MKSILCGMRYQKLKSALWPRAPFVELAQKSPVPEFIDPVFMKTSPKRSFSVIQNERFGLVFAKTGSIISGTELRSAVFFRLLAKRSYMNNLSIHHWCTKAPYTDPWRSCPQENRFIQITDYFHNVEISQPLLLFKISNFFRLWQESMQCFQQ